MRKSSTVHPYSSPYNNSNNPLCDDNSRNSTYHLHTRYITPQQRMSQIPYENLKRQIQFNNFFNPNHIDDKVQTNPDDAIREIEKMINGQDGVDRQKLSGNITAIKLTPIINDNYISSFNQNDYNLRPEDKVKITKQKVFKVQNYYNYLYELQTKKKVHDINSQIQALTNSRRQSLDDDQVIGESKGYVAGRESSYMQGRHNSKIPQNAKQLDPVYQKYEEKNFAVKQSYFLKEKDRIELQKRFDRAKARGNF